MRVQTVRPRLHIFGHIHNSCGAVVLGYTTFVNACIPDEDHKRTRWSIVICLKKPVDLERRPGSKNPLVRTYMEARVATSNILSQSR